MLEPPRRLRRVVGRERRRWRRFVVVSRVLAFAFASSLASSCGLGSGSAWLARPLVAEPIEPVVAPSPASPASPAASAPPPAREESATEPAEVAAATSANDPPPPSPGTFVGVFRNTYYDFPHEADYAGAPTALMSSACEPLASVPRGFFETVCVQGSGLLARGGTVSFARRDCACAEVCPRTGQRICFDALDAARFPWGRGATGHAITPLLTVAADTTVLPLGTPVYIAEFDGVVRADSGERHDGCFIVQDRGIHVLGLHVDVFTGSEAMTRALGKLVPSNMGVRVHTGTPKCERLRGSTG
jgi:3D (Asp-Asp-Asp) domain-containing protein